MGCNCGGGASNGNEFLVTLADGTQKLVPTEPGARLAVTMGGGAWREVGREEADQLRASGSLTI
jgi:hypothetical protein